MSHLPCKSEPSRSRSAARHAATAKKSSAPAGGRRPWRAFAFALARARSRSTAANWRHYFPSEKERGQLLEALVKADRRQSVDVIIRVNGGGPAGQAGACKLGIARALRKYDSSLDELLRHSGLLTRDGRMKERKHYGLRGARRGTQFSKR